MTIGKALELVVREYDKAKAQEWIHNPVAWALYVVWKIADAERREEWTEKEYEYVTLHHEDIHFIDEDAERAFYESLAERKEE